MQLSLAEQIVNVLPFDSKSGARFSVLRSPSVPQHCLGQAGQGAAANTCCHSGIPCRLLSDLG